MKYLLVLLFLSFFKYQASVALEIKGIDPEKVVASTDDEYLKKLIEGYNQFAFKLYHTFKGREDNSIIASYPLGMGLGMLGEGAKGETKNQIQEALQFSLNIVPFTQTINQYLKANDKPTRQTQLSMLAGIWLQSTDTLLPSYKYALKRNFNFDLTPVDFNTPSKVFNTINRWISTQSHNKINQLISYRDFSRETQLLVTTGFYWRGEWEHPFDVKQTKKALFTYRGSAYNLEMMQQVANHFILIQPHFVIIDLPFKPFEKGGAQLSFTILLPNEGVNLNAIEKELTTDQWYRWMGALKSQEVELYLPKLRIEKQLDLSQTLQQLGIVQAFNSSADFTAVEAQKIHLNKIVQKIIFPLAEGGSDALAPRYLRSQVLKKDVAPYLLKIDRPFFFVIQETTTKLILCIGRIEQP